MTQMRRKEIEVNLEIHTTDQPQRNKTLITGPKYPVIDFHTHLGEMQDGSLDMDYDTAALVAGFKERGITGVVNLDMMYGDIRDRVMAKQAGYEDFFINFGAPDVTRFEEPDFEKMVYRQITDNVKNYGMKGIKLWLNIGLSLQYRDGRYLKPDDERLGCIYQMAAEYDIPVLYHIAEVKAFFEPMDEHNDRYQMLKAFPEWSYADPKYPGFEELMECQEHIIEDNPKTAFVIAHVGSYAENLNQVSAWLRRYPNMYVDISARIDELGRKPDASRRFFLEHEDRILFGTDFTYKEDPYPEYWRFLETYDKDFNPYGADPLHMAGWDISGIGLPDETLKKIYYGNAEKLLHGDVPL